MKRQRIRYKLLALFLFALFAGLAVYGGTTWLINGSRWFAFSKNPRISDQKQSVIAGDILDRGGVVLAATDAEGRRVYQSEEAARRAMVHLLGDTDNHVANAVESFQSSYLYGFQASLGERVADLRSGKERKGDTVQLTVSAPLTTALSEALLNACDPEDPRGAAVVLNWKTGEVLAAVSLPSFDPDRPSETLSGEGAPSRNRVTQGAYTPGAAFEPVTEAAALIFLHADGTADVHREILARRLTAGNLRTAAERFGFNDNFLFRDLVVDNSSFPAGGLTETEWTETLAGRGAVRATPIHLCMIAAGIANGGVVMEPRLLLRVTGDGGAGRLTYTAAEYARAMDPAEAARLRESLRRRAPAGLPETVCGVAGGAGPDSWFLGFAADEAMPCALCLVVEDGADRDAAEAAARDAFAWLQAHPDAYSVAE